MHKELREQIRGLLRPPAAIHVVGVAGAGMSALANLLLQRGFRVSGSDLVPTHAVEGLIEHGLVFTAEHTASAVQGAQLVVYSSAVAEDNVERQAARELGIPEIRRAELLAVLVEEKQSLVVAGMHGKTTSSSMLTYVLRVAGETPSHYIGAEVPILGASSAWSPSGPIVIEGDESDGTLTAFQPTHSLLLNVEEEHLDYYDNLDAILQVFARFVAETSGRVVFCADDANALLLCSHHEKAVGYGLAEHARYRAVDVRVEQFASEFRILRDGHELGRIALNVPGTQNVLNALGVAALALEIGVPMGMIQKALAEFRGASRRFEVKHHSSDYLLVDDYAHHPTEIKATLGAARAGGWKRIVALFQPHRYTRTKLLLQDFADAFEQADLVVVTDIYAASEEPIEGIDGGLLAETVRQSGHGRVIFEPDLQRLARVASREIIAGDLTLTLGAGSIHEVATVLAAELDWFTELRRQLSPESRLLRNEKMSRHTTLRVGGPAQFWFEPAQERDLQLGLQAAHAQGIPVTLIGRGSNLLVREGGIPGLCVHLGHRNFSQVSIVDGRITVGAGTRLKNIVTEAKRQGIGGLSFLEGIPGSVGGALRMNAGAMQGWTMEVVEEVRAFDLQGNLKIIRHEDLEIRYRNVPFFATHIAVGAKLRGQPESTASIDAELKEYAKKRWASQPAAPSAGCIFKNPLPATPAGRLIDELGLKNLARGGARVSEVHANFIVNDGPATANDVLNLIADIQARAREQRGIELEPEVVILGEDL